MGGRGADRVEAFGGEGLLELFEHMFLPWIQMPEPSAQWVLQECVHIGIRPREGETRRGEGRGTLGGRPLISTPVERRRGFRRLREGVLGAFEQRELPNEPTLSEKATTQKT